MYFSTGEHTLKLLALFFSSYFKAHLKLLETPELTDALNHGLMYLLCISELPDPEIFKICLEYWHIFANELYTDDSQIGSRGPLALGLGNGVSRKSLYRQDLLCRLRTVMISNMAKPEEVVVVEDENGDIVREMQKDTEVIAQYKTMRETLVYLTHLNYEDTESIMLDKLAAQVDKTSNEWSWNNLNTLCWAIGSISGSMSEEEEKRFLVTVIKDLLGLCEEKRGKDNKAVIASNIMYVVGQYPRFLRAHWKFLKTVANKLFEFMHEKHPGVQDMACETFLKIAQKCKRKFVTLQQGEQQPFVVELTEMIPSIILELEAHQIQTFYEAAACMLSERTLTPGIAGVVAAPLNRQECLMALLSLPNQTWTSIMDMAGASNGESLKAPETMRELTRFLKLNIRVCSAVGPLYVTELQVLFGDLMNVYTAYSEYQFLMVETQGEMTTHNSLFKAMRSVKKETLRLLTTFMERCGDPEAPPLTVAQSIMPPLLQSAPTSVLGDYHRSIPNARDPEVLALFSACIVKLPLNEIEGGSAVPSIMAALFECTLQMITGNFEDYPELRLQFFTLLKAINSHCFSALFTIPQEHRKLVVDSVAFAVKHTERNVAETGLDILFELLKNVEQNPQVSQEFYQQFLIQLLEQVLYVLTDRLHKSGIKMHATLLQHMLHLVAMGKVTVPLFDTTNFPPGTTNQDYVRDYIGNLLSSQFTNLNKNQVVAFVQGLFDINMDVATFKQHLRDFLITLKEFAGDEDNAQLYDEETQVQKGEAAAQEVARRQAVPGILNPYEVPDDMTL
jgi:exportin-1